MANAALGQKFDWDDVSGADSYDARIETLGGVLVGVEKNVADSEIPVDALFLDGSGNPLVDTSTTYQLKVRSRNVLGVSAYSNVSVTPAGPGLPVNLTVV